MTRTARLKLVARLRALRKRYRLGEYAPKAMKAADTYQIGGKGKRFIYTPKMRRFRKRLERRWKKEKRGRINWGAPVGTNSTPVFSGKPFAPPPTFDS
jgi:benzoyl-CoA reductase/2-hydroxyglutaryl-CoA dehydratase subunit BcrC/BadD/HgdB